MKVTLQDDPWPFDLVISDAGDHWPWPFELKLDKKVTLQDDPWPFDLKFETTVTLQSVVMTLDLLSVRKFALNDHITCRQFLSLFCVSLVWPGYIDLWPINSVARSIRFPAWLDIVELVCWFGLVDVSVSVNEVTLHWAVLVPTPEGWKAELAWAPWVQITCWRLSFDSSSGGNRTEFVMCLAENKLIMILGDFIWHY